MRNSTALDEVRARIVAARAASAGEEIGSITVTPEQYRELLGTTDPTRDGLALRVMGVPVRVERTRSHPWGSFPLPFSVRNGFRDA